MFWSQHLWNQWLLSRQEPPHGAEGPDVIPSGCFVPNCFDKSTYNIPRQVLQGNFHHYVTPELSQLPQTSFPHPLLMLLQLRASKYPGVLLILVMSLYSHACWSPNTLDDNSLGNSPNIDAKSVEEFHHLFEVLLCFEAWYWLDAVPKEDVDSGQVSSAIRTAIEKVVAIVDRQEGLGMKLTKVHCPTHTLTTLLGLGPTRTQIWVPVNLVIKST